jgi:maleylacetate reductase
MNALAHAADCLYTPLANPVSEMAALRGAKLIAKALDRDPAKRKPEELALGAILSGYAIDSALFGLHHVVSQSLVRVMRLSHAETNAAVLPRVTELLISRAGPEMTALARAIGTKQADLPQRIEELAGGRRHLGEIGGDRALINDAVTTIMARPELKMTPDAPDESASRGLIENAW